MFENIRKVIYKKKNMLAFEEYFELEINEDANILKYNDGRHSNTIDNVNDELVMNYFDRLFRIIDGWEEEYIDNTVIDGVEWKLQITYKDGFVKQYNGKNDFPNNFEYLDKINHEIVNKM